MAEVPTFSARFTADLVNSKGNASWPLSSYFYMLIADTSMTDAQRAEFLVDWIWWIVSTSDGAHLAELNRSTSPLLQSHLNPLPVYSNND